jgi:hypothetical protein
MEQRVAVLALLAIGLVQTVLVALRLPGWPCAFRQATGIPCPGCGLSRALASLLHGDVSRALAFHAFAPVAVACGLLLAASVVLRDAPRQRLAARVAAFESSTGIAVWLAAAFLVYWVVRLLYYPLTFKLPG